VTDTARLLLTAAVLSGSAVLVFAWRLIRTDPSQPDRVVGELRLAQLAAVILAVSGGLSVGLAVAADGVPVRAFDTSVGIACAAVAGLVLTREPRDGLLLAAAGLMVHALTDLAHRPGWLPPGLAPAWLLVGSAVYDVAIATACYWARRR